MPLNPLISKAMDAFIDIACKLEVNDNNGNKIPLATKTELGDIKNLSGYAEREGFFGIIATIVYRIWNAVKAIFGKSTWQRAERALISIQNRISVHKEGKEMNEEEISKAKEFVPELLNKINMINKILKGSESNPNTIFLVNTIISGLQAEKIAHDGLEIPQIIEKRARDILKGAGASEGIAIPLQTQIVAFARCGYTDANGFSALGQLVNIIGKEVVENLIKSNPSRSVA